jgi:hypothetical protein
MLAKMCLPFQIAFNPVQAAGLGSKRTGCRRWTVRSNVGLKDIEDSCP